MLLEQEYCRRVCAYALYLTRILEYAILALISSADDVRRDSERNDSEVICEVKAELRDGIGAGKLRDVVVALEQETERERAKEGGSPSPLDDLASQEAADLIARS